MSAHAKGWRPAYSKYFSALSQQNGLRRLSDPQKWALLAITTTPAHTHESKRLVRELADARELCLQAKKLAERLNQLFATQPWKKTRLQARFHGMAGSLGELADAVNNHVSSFAKKGAEANILPFALQIQASEMIRYWTGGYHDIWFAEFLQHVLPLDEDGNVAEFDEGTIQKRRIRFCQDYPSHYRLILRRAMYAVTSAEHAESINVQQTVADSTTQTKTRGTSSSQRARTDRAR